MLARCMRRMCNNNLEIRIVGSYFFFIPVGKTARGYVRRLVRSVSKVLYIVLFNMTNINY